MKEKYNKLQPKSKTIDELKVAMQTIWEELPQEHINMAVENFTKRLTVCWSLRAPAITLSISKSASSSQHEKRFFSEPPTYYRRKLFEALQTRN